MSRAPDCYSRRSPYNLLNPETFINPAGPSPDDSSMRHHGKRAPLARLLRDERGGEVIEWTLVAGLIVIGTLAVIGAFGTKVLARWNTVNNGL